MKTTLRFLLVFCIIWIFARTAIYLLPGNPADFLFHESLVKIPLEELRSKMDLQTTPWQRIFSWPNEVSLVNGKKVVPLVIAAFQRSLILTVLTFLFTGISVVWLLYFGFISERAKRAADFFSLLVASAPLIVMGPLFLLVGSFWLKWFSPANHPLLPAITLSCYLTGFWYRTLSKQVQEAYATSAAPGARARGVPEFEVFFRYLLFPTLGKFASFLGTQMSTLLNGSILIEVIFQWNGLGNLLADAILSRDYPIIEITLLTLTLITLLSQQFGYWLQRQWDPRIS